MRVAVSPMNTTTTSTPAPWYRQFWPWFLIALPGSVIVAGIGTLLLALSHDDSRVRDNYYKEGLAINQTLAADQRAQQLGLQAALQLDHSGRLTLQLSGQLAAPAQLQLQLIHPLDSERDTSALLTPHDNARPGHYSGQLQALPSGRWHLELTDPTDRSWRLRSSAMLTGATTLTLHGDATATDR